jgi:hypothetical protein
MLEAVFGVLVTLGIALPAMSAGVHHLAVSNAVDGYHEYLNGSMTVTRVDTINCTEDGQCVYVYDCDPYDVPVYRTVTTYDAKGNVTGSYQVIDHYDTYYHRCPYVTAEFNYWIADSLGQHIVVMNNVFAANPQEWHGDRGDWHPGNGIPGNVQRGDPPAWTEAKAAIDRGDNPPTVKLHDYTNYLLAAQDNILQAHSDKINSYREKGLMPDHKQLVASVHGLSTADKVVFVQTDPGDKRQEWQDAVNHLNSLLGTALQGDLHVVVVSADKVGSGESEQYTTAVLADWQSRQMDKDGLAKNAILLVIGAGSDGKVAWSRAKTGIPEGNGAMLSALSNDLEGKPMEPRSLIGWPKVSSNDNGTKLLFAPSNGEVERIVLRDYPFERPCMMCKDATDHGQGYVFLKDSALLPTWEKYTVVALVTLFAVIVFVILAFIDLHSVAISAYGASRDFARSQWRNVRRRLNR